MKNWTPQQLASYAGAELLRAPAAEQGGPQRAVLDSRQAKQGDLFVAVNGTRVDGAIYAKDVLRSGAWGVLTHPAGARAALEATADTGGVVLAAERPERALGAMARKWRQEVGMKVVAVTGSVGKTSTKDLIAAMLAPHKRTAWSHGNLNTEFGLPLELLAVPADCEIAVLEMGMRGLGQIAALADICDPDVGVITNIAPVHLELLGSLEGVAEAKGELIVGMRDGGTAVVPSNEPLLRGFLRDTLRTFTFGSGGDVSYLNAGARSGSPHQITLPEGEGVLELELPFRQQYNLENALAAVAAAIAIGVRPNGKVEIEFSPLRGEEVKLASGAVVINDCYNANPLSMRAALVDFMARETAGRRVAVLGDMLELGVESERYHAELAKDANTLGIDLLVTVGNRSATMTEYFTGETHATADAEDASALLAELLRPTDLVLVKGSRGLGLERIAHALSAPQTQEHELQATL